MKANDKTSMASDLRHRGALNRTDSATYLSVSIRLMDDLLSAGAIPKLKIGRKTLVRVCDLDSYLASLVEKSEVTK